MLPPVSLGALLIVLALVPGWLYLRLVERLQPRTYRSGLHQLLEVLAIGAATTGLGAAAVLLLPHRLLPFALDLDAWEKAGNAYLRSHVRGAVWSTTLTFAAAVVVAYILYLLRARRRPAEFHSGSVWVGSLGARPDGMVPYVGLHLDDGRLVEGPLHAYTLDEEAGKRDIALAKPIRITPAGSTSPQKVPNLDRLIVPESKVDFISVIHLPGLAEKRRWFQRHKQGR